jgi:phospholipid transport system substrate-binding protein
MRIPALIAVVVIVLQFVAPARLAGASETGNPAAAVLAEFEPMLASIDAILADSQASADEKRALIERELDIWIDYGAMAAAALGPRGQEFSRAELVAFANEFERFFQHFYISRISIRSDAARRAVEALHDPQTGTVTVRAPGAASVGAAYSQRSPDPHVVDALFQLRKRYGDWRIVGIAIGGVEVTRLFREQFESLLRSDSPEELIARLRDHNEKLEAQNPLQR